MSSVYKEIRSKGLFQGLEIYGKNVEEVRAKTECEFDMSPNLVFF